MKYLILIFSVVPFFMIGQSEWRLKAYGGKANLFEAVVANEVSGSVIGIGLEKRINKLSYFINIEKISCQSDQILGIPQTRIDGGEWMLSRYKGYINLERRDFAFDDVKVEEDLFSAGTWNDVGARQAFNSNNLLLGMGYRILKYKRLTIWPSLGLAISKINATAINYGYSTTLGLEGKRYSVVIPSYISYLYISGYVNLPFNYEISSDLEFSLLGILYRANDLYLPALGVSLNLKL